MWVAAAFISASLGSVVIDPVTLRAADFEFGDYTATGLSTVQLWLSGLDAGDALLDVFGRPLLPLTIETTDPAGFFNGLEVGQSHYAAAEALYPVFPELQWDTFVTIGRSADTRVSAGFPDTALFGGGSTLLGAHVSWFDLVPGSPESEVDGRILIGQFSFRSEHALNFEEMQINVTLVDASGNQREIWEVPILPEPGGFVLLALFSRVRRRRH